MTGTAPSSSREIVHEPGWLLRARGHDPATSRHHEGLFTQGSGYLHVRGSLEEPVAGAPQDLERLREPGDVTAEEFPDLPAKWGTYVPGVFADHPTLGHEMVNLPFFLGWALRCGDDVLDASRSDLLVHERTLDLRDGRLRREVRWRTRSGGQVHAVFERFVSAARPHACLQRLSLSADRPLGIQVTSFIDADVRTNGFDHLTRTQCRGRDAHDVVCRVKTNGGDVVEMLSRFLHDGTRALAASGDRCGSVSRIFELEGGTDPLVLEKRTVVATSRDLGGRALGDHVAEVMLLSWDELVEENRAVWAERWRRCEVEVDGDPESRRALRVALYHLLRSHVPDDPRVAIGAKGFAGDAYYGRFFWDTEMFLLPFFLYTDPVKARTLVDFRRTTLEGARENARAGGFRGARYAWESGTSGREQCPAWPYDEQEVHITADVVYGFAHYARAAEPQYLAEAAAEAIVETARFWSDRIEETSDGRLRLAGVLGPDEYTPSCTNNAFTNRLVRFALEAAVEAGARGGASEEERERFAGLARRLPVPRAADETLVLQSEEWEGLEEPDFDELWPDRTRPLAAQVGVERLHRTKAAKQADVLMLMALFPDEFTDEEVCAAWERYVPYTTHDSSLSAGIHGIVASRLGRRDDAWAFWLRSRDLDTDPRHGGAAEGIHIANAGCVWMQAVTGFAGVRSAMATDVLTLDPRLPDAWARLGFPLVWKGTPVHIELTPAEARVTNRGETELAVRVVGESRIVSPGETARFELGEPEPRRIEAVLFDLDGVLVSTDRLHFRAWSELARRENIPFDWETNHRLRGVSRAESLEILLERASRKYAEAERQEMLAFKNGLYRDSLGTMTPADILPGSRGVLARLREEGLRTAIVSASRNAPLILECVDLEGSTDVVVDGNDTTRSKPDPEAFLLAAERLDVDPSACLVVEDASAGVEAARRAGMAVLAVGDRTMHPDVARVVSGLDEVTVADLRASVDPAP